MAAPAPRLSERKRRLRAEADRLAPERARWIERNAYFHAADFDYMRFLVPAGMRVLDLGCGIGELLAGLAPAYGVGVDFSANMIAEARRRHPHLHFVVGDIEDPAVLRALDGPFDFIVMSDTIGALEDCDTTLALLHELCAPDTRLIVAYYSRLWDPLLRIAEALGMRMPSQAGNNLSADDIAGLMDLADFEVVRREWRQLVPRRLFGLGPLINRHLAGLPLVRRACLRNYVVGRSRAAAASPPRSASIVIPVRNERGNIEPAIRRIPRFCDDLEYLFVEGHSSDGTADEIRRVIDAYPDLDIRMIRQDGIGKADAVFKAFEHASGEVLMILDGDLTTPPEDLPRFWNALVRGKGEFINGSRLVYPMEREAMRFLNHVANRLFAVVFSWLLNQRFTDTLCGTKVLRREHYRRIRDNRAYFGDFDPFGDFDLIFGAAKLNLKIVEVPVHYANRAYGNTQIARFRHGFLLLRMVVFAYRKLKAI